MAASFFGKRATPKSTEQKVLNWLAAAQPPVDEIESAIEAVAWAIVLPKIASQIDPEVWTSLHAALVALANSQPEDAIEKTPVVHQILRGELAWRLAVGLPDDREARRLSKSGRAAISLGFHELLDRDGMTSAADLPFMRVLLACWTRCYALGRELSHGGWGAQCQQRYERLVQTAMRLTRPDGRAAFEASDDAPEGGKLFAAAAINGKNKVNRRLAAIALSPMRGVAGKKTKKVTDLPTPSVHCEDACVAVLRRGWQRDDERLAVTFSGEKCRIELVASGQVALSGDWQFEVRRGGELLKPISPWESVCWHSDEDVDYLELEIELADGVKLERQIVLARQDRFLLMADAVLTKSPGGIAYCGSLPLAGRFELCGAAETRETYLTTGKNSRPSVQILPLALPEWRAETHLGELLPAGPSVQLLQATEGRNLFAPLFFDLDRSRCRKRTTWRQVHVAETLTNLSADVAAGYRVAIGKKQWLIYRALAAKGNRTLLGHNLSTETLVARFASSGEVTSIVEIE